MSLKEKIQTGLAERRAERSQRQKEAAENFAKIYAQRQAEALRDHWKKVGEELGDFSGHMLMVTNFGGLHPYSYNHGKKIAESVKKQLGFDTDTSITMSVHAGKNILEERHNGWDEYMESAMAIRDSLEELGYDKMVPDSNVLMGSGYETPPGFAAGSFRAGAQTAIEYASLDPEKNLHILVTSALDTNEVGVPYSQSAGGHAFLLETAPQDGTQPVWRKVELHYRYE